ncbi:MAG: hypothetical protein ACHQM6_05590, partial [Candidatus Kapaibacterium sp.]
MRTLLPALFIGLILACGMFTSCKKHINGPPEDTTHKCDTCNLNQDSLQKIKDSLAHAFVWTEYIDQLPGDGSPTGVWVFGPNDILICANSIWHFDGTNFTLIDEHYTRHPTISLNGAMNGNNIFAFSDTDFWLVDGIIFHSTDAHHLDDMRPPGDIRACWGTSSKDMFFVGRAGYIYHWDGTSFTQMNSNTKKDLYSVWGTSSSDVWACGANDATGETIILHYDGSNWTTDNLSQTTSALRSGLEATWACDSAGHKFVATSGAFVYRKMDNGIWKNDSGSIPNALGGDSYVGLYLLRGNSPNDIMAAGSWGWVGHWNGKTWKKYDNLYDYSNTSYIANALSLNGNT